MPEKDKTHVTRQKRRRINCLRHERKGIAYIVTSSSINKADMAGLIGSGKLKGPNGRKVLVTNEMQILEEKQSSLFLVKARSWGVFLIRLKFERPLPG